MRVLSRTDGRPRSRFTMLEGLIAVIILALVLVGAAPLFYFGRSLLHRSSLMRQAVEVGTEELEYATTAGFSQVEEAERQVSLGQTEAAVTTRIQEAHIDAEGEGYKQVSVRVDWQVGDKQEEVVLTTYLSSAASSR